MRWETANDRYIEQWAFFFLYADRYDARRLREILLGEEFQKAISVMESIAAKKEDRAMYDQREKALRDYQWAMDGAREEGREEGALAGKVQLLQQLLVLQQLLGEEPSPMEALLEQPRDELVDLVAQLQERLRTRNG